MTKKTPVKNPQQTQFILGKCPLCKGELKNGYCDACEKKYKGRMFGYMVLIWCWRCKGMVKHQFDGDALRFKCKRCSLDVELVRLITRKFNFSAKKKPT